MNLRSRRIRLGRKPAAQLAPEDFTMDEIELPPMRAGEVLTRTLYLSLDPYLTGFMRHWRGPQPDWSDGIIVGRTIGQVVASRAEGLNEGDLVLGNGRWQDHDVRPAAELEVIRDRSAPVTACVGVLGISGLTAWIGVTQVLQVQSGQTMTVSAAAGTVGSVAGQIAKRLGCRVVGIAGGPDKCAYVVDELGFDACSDYRAEGFEQSFAAALPEGIDRHFENVGARMLDAAIGSAKNHAVIALCGLIAHYQDDRPITLARFRDLLYRSITVQPFHVVHYAEKFAAARSQLQEWLADGRLKMRETVTEGLEQAPQAFIGMLSGAGAGKHLVKVA